MKSCFASFLVYADGTNSILEMTQAFQASESEIRRLVDELVMHDLIRVSLQTSRPPEIH